MGSSRFMSSITRTKGPADGAAVNGWRGSRAEARLLARLGLTQVAQQAQEQARAAALRTSSRLRPRRSSSSGDLMQERIQTVISGSHSFTTVSSYVPSIRVTEAEELSVNADGMAEAFPTSDVVLDLDYFNHRSGPCTPAVSAPVTPKTSPGPTEGPEPGAGPQGRVNAPTADLSQTRAMWDTPGPAQVASDAFGSSSAEVQSAAQRSSTFALAPGAVVTAGDAWAGPAGAWPGQPSAGAGSLTGGGFSGEAFGSPTGFRSGDNMFSVSTAVMARLQHQSSSSLGKTTSGRGLAPGSPSRLARNSADEEVIQASTGLPEESSAADPTAGNQAAFRHGSAATLESERDPGWALSIAPSFSLAGLHRPSRLEGSCLGPRQRSRWHPPGHTLRLIPSAAARDQASATGQGLQDARESVYTELVPLGGAPQRQGAWNWRQAVGSALGAAALVCALAVAQPLWALAEPALTFPWASPPAVTTPATQEMKMPERTEETVSELSADELSAVRLFQDNTPTVVNIANIGERQNYLRMDVQKIPQGMGSGFVWDTKGHIVTNFHVIKGAADVKVALIDQSVYPATLVGGDPDKDVAVLQLQAPPEKLRELKPVSLGNSSRLLVGQKVFAIGNPFGLDHTLTQGIVSGLGRELATPGYRGVPIRNVIQTDAAINPGNSGGVLLDSKGRLIGINTAIADPSGRGASSGVGFAIPIDTVTGLVEQILTYGRVVRPVLGITIAPPQAVSQLGLEGVLVLDVPEGSPASKAGFKGTFRDGGGRLVLGDIITGIDGRPVKVQKDLFEILDDCKVGQKIEVDVLREGRQRKVPVTLGERSAELD
ncbi:hypothetical protein WJX72_008397 [[Myrmecia] bisecta]|uniref:PDZ domain-containing protein n=1 Tax=[Myrmecia] bisecta TaxID=41462 RepID=A0AAW1QFQ5_9CHLO